MRAPCVVCSLPSDPGQTSAHFAGVWRFCDSCGTAFHSVDNLGRLAECGRYARQREGTSGTLAMWKFIESWIFQRRAELQRVPASSPSDGALRAARQALVDDEPGGAA